MRKVIIMAVLAACGLRCAAGTGGGDSLLVARGDSCMTQYDYFHAMKWYEQAVADGSDLATVEKLAKVHFLRADYRRCVSLLEALPADSIGHDALRELFYSHKALSHQGRQMAWGRRLLGRYPMDSEVVADMAQELNLDTPELALELTEKYESEDSTNILVKRQHADALFFMQRYGEASRVYRQLLALGDTTFSVCYSLGMSYEQLATRDDGSTDSLLLAEAIGYYGQAVALNDSVKAWPLYHLGTALVKANRNAEGIHILLMALQKMQPDDSAMFNLHWALAEGYYQNEEYYSAIYDWKNCLKYNAHSLASLYNIGQTYELIDDPARAEEGYVAFLKIADYVKEPTATLREWMEHAETFGNVRAIIEKHRARMRSIIMKSE